MPSETTYPYADSNPSTLADGVTSTTSACQSGKPLIPFTVKTNTATYGTFPQLKAALLVSPVMMDIDAADNVFQFYQTGLILTDQCGTKVGSNSYIFL